jgi:hypothetical protein
VSQPCSPVGKSLGYGMHCVFGLVGIYFLKSDHVSEMQEVSPQSLTVPSGKVRFFAIEITNPFSTSFIHTTLHWP